MGRSTYARLPSGPSCRMSQVVRKPASHMDQPSSNRPDVDLLKGWDNESDVRVLRPDNSCHIFHACSPLATGPVYCLYVSIIASPQLDLRSLFSSHSWRIPSRVVDISRLVSQHGQQRHFIISTLSPIGFRGLVSRCSTRALTALPRRQFLHHLFSSFWSLSKM